MSPQRCGPGNIHGFVLGGKSYQQGWTTAQTPHGPAASFMHVEPRYYFVQWAEPFYRLV